MYFVSQRGFEGKWCKDAGEVVRFLCDLFGFDFQQVFERLLDQIQPMQRKQVLTHPDLALSIEKF